MDGFILMSIQAVRDGLGGLSERPGNEHEFGRGGGTRSGRS